nr:PREDICTED: uncharacterized protein LOC109044334 isoform X2 [Bemisia tabaci]
MSNMLVVILDSADVTSGKQSELGSVVKPEVVRVAGPEMGWTLLLLLLGVALVPLVSSVETIPFCEPIDINTVHTLHEDERADFGERETMAKMVSCILNRSLLNMVTDLTLTGLVRKLDPLYIGYLEYDIFEPDLGLNVSGSLHGFNVDNFSKLYVRNLAVDLRRMKSDVQLEFERVQATALYNISGLMNQANTTAELFGNGHFKANFSNVFVNASLSFAMPNLMLQMQGFDYDYEVGNFHVEMNGVFDDPFLSVLLNSMANDVGTRFLNERKPLIKKMIREQMNAFLSQVVVSQMVPQAPFVAKRSGRYF